MWVEVEVEVKVEVMVEVVVDIVISKVCDLCIIIDSCNKINGNFFLMMSHFQIICSCMYISVSCVILILVALHMIPNVCDALK